MYDITGERTGGGSPDWLADQSPAKQNAAAIDRLLAAGADIIGKTVCDEFFFSLTGANAHYGTPVNIRAPGRLPGGSSSGSAAAVAAGAFDIPPRRATRGARGGSGALFWHYGICPPPTPPHIPRALPLSPALPP